MKRTRLLLPLGLLAAVGVLALCGTGAATTQPIKQKDYVPPPWKYMNVSMDILVDGKPLPTVNWKGKTYLPVPHWGMPYEIRVWNHGSKRITAIVSVDGLSVINGEPASENHPGYIVYPGSSVVIKGWRQNDDTVAAFTFVKHDQSYASQVGHPENVGVIGLVAFEELKYLPGPYIEPMYSGGPKAAADGAGGKAVPAPGVGGTGTGYGKTIYSPVYEVPFVRSTHKQTAVFYYDTVANLQEMGVPVSPTYPNPFPGDPK